MSLIEDVVQKTLDSMSAADRQHLIMSVVERMLGQMSAAERVGLMEHVVDRFMDGLSAEERQSTVHELMPHLLAQLMKSGNMNVDQLLWAAMDSLGALDKTDGSISGTPAEGAQGQAGETKDNHALPE